MARCFHLFVQSSSPGVFWFSSAPVALWVPPQCLPCDVVCWHPQCVLSPSPFSAGNLVLYFLLPSVFPEVFVSNPVWPSYTQDSSHAKVDETVFSFGVHPSFLAKLFFLASVHVCEPVGLCCQKSPGHLAVSTESIVFRFFSLL